MKADVSTTLTTEAIEFLDALAQDAYKDISALPESCQPLWFRQNKHTITL